MTIKLKLPSLLGYDLILTHFSAVVACIYFRECFAGHQQSVEHMEIYLYHKNLSPLQALDECQRLQVGNG